MPMTGNKRTRSGQHNQQRYQAVIQKMKDSSMGIYDKVNPVITVNGSSGTSTGMFGNAGDIVVISVDCSWTFAPR